MGKVRRERVFFAAAQDGKLFVELKAVMHPFVALADGLTIVHFKGEKKLYLLVDDAIGWCQRESRCHDKDMYEKMIAVMEMAKVQNAQEIACP